MEQHEIETFKYNVDCWIKDINAKVTKFAESTESFHDNLDNIEHNYELIHEIKTENEDLKKQVQQLKMTQLLMIKKLFREDFQNASKNKKFMEKIANLGMPGTEVTE